MILNEKQYCRIKLNFAFDCPWKTTYCGTTAKCFSNTVMLHCNNLFFWAAHFVVCLYLFAE